MNPLTQIKNTQKVSKAEIAAGLSESASWHARFKHSAYVFTGGLPYDLTEGDLLAVFAQYGEPVDVNLVRDPDTKKSKGFAFLAYEDQRSTVLAVDNLSGARVAGRVIRVEHVDNYRRKRAEMEGRELSPSSEEEEEEEEEQGEEAAPSAAPAQRATVQPSDGGGDAPWASSGSVFALLNDATAGHPPGKVAANGAAARRKEGKKEKKVKKEKKDKKEKKQKHKKKDNGEPGMDSTPGPSPDRAASPVEEPRSHRNGAREPAPAAPDRRPPAHGSRPGSGSHRGSREGAGREGRDDARRAGATDDRRDKRRDSGPGSGDEGRRHSRLPQRGSGRSRSPRRRSRSRSPHYRDRRRD